ncbi:membrane protein insertase YidC [Bacteriovoracaceae bacterium]|nr:membrane protein insertase YidC [Bacteriovoracaceae bacterium]
MNREQSNMFLAILLSGIVLFGWQFYFGPKTDAEKNKQDQSVVGSTDSPNSIGSQSSPAPNNAQATNSNQGVVQKNSTNTILPQAPVELEEKTLTSDSTSFTIESNLTIISASNINEKIKFQEFTENINPFYMEFYVNNQFQKLFFELSDIKEGIKAVNQAYGIEFLFSFKNSELADINLFNPNLVPYRFVFKGFEHKLENGTYRSFAYFQDELEYFGVEDEESGEAKVQWFGLDYNYHLLALTRSEKTLYSFKSTDSTIYWKTINPKREESFQLVYTLKELDHLTALGSHLDKAIDFGIMGIIAVWLLWFLQNFYEVVPNYGISIIVLTVIIRLMTFPLQIKSFKSMKKMQEIQPQLTKLKEKFKDDPQRMQKESMELFKRNGANPLGGCLPLLLQMPIFFAFYRVLGSSVELVGAPFYLWITDLSVKDPFYVLPILMAITMFVQQKITPSTTADPTQKKIMMFMPLIFGLIMKDLPSGLTLYIFVSTLVGIGQQMLVYRRT